MTCSTMKVTVSVQRKWNYIHKYKRLHVFNLYSHRRLTEYQNHLAARVVEFNYKIYFSTDVKNKFRIYHFKRRPWSNESLMNHSHQLFTVCAFSQEMAYVEDNTTTRNVPSNKTWISVKIIFRCDSNHAQFS